MLVLKIDKNASQGVRSRSMKYPYDDNWENQNPELCVAKSFSLKRKLIAGIRLRARYLKMPMSAYVAALVHNDLERGMDAPLQIDAGKSTEAPPQQSRGVVVEFDLSEDE
jgi:hypothetical protein